jgi:hypothetical protein
MLIFPTLNEPAAGAPLSLDAGDGAGFLVVLFVVPAFPPKLE